ncbi:hypothetical protein QR680_001307 [Steinernema hermaphroditum]|uniref:ZP domain-containing protein n=1 Tax=Steinernema hermaphroditum TaxID=289476 RepID=A0AA39LFT1_9BILA|nr:hypothetical protein QR680_001307 [Steinernema hermaphroditum]
MILLIIVVLLFSSIKPLRAVPIDNNLTGEPVVNCGSDSISLDLVTSKEFSGKIFVKGYSQDAECMRLGGNGKAERFEIKFDHCGMRRSRELNGVSISTTVIISFHPIFITKVDRAYRVNCFYMEATKTIGQQLDVSMLTTRSITQQTQMPVCKYEILSGGPSGTPVRYARIGDHVYHKWSCVAESPDIYCMRVHTCTVYDGQGGEPVLVLDKNGCEVDRFVLQNLEYTNDLMAGQEAHVFKFADRPALYFNCQIALTVKDHQYGCDIAQPSCEQPTIGREAVAVTPLPSVATKNTNHEYAQRPLPTAHFETILNQTNPAYGKFESGYTQLTQKPFEQTQVYPSVQENIYDDILTSTKKNVATTRGPPGYSPPPHYTDNVDYQEFSDTPNAPHYDDSEASTRPYNKKVVVRRETNGALSEFSSITSNDCITIGRVMVTVGIVLLMCAGLLAFSVVIIRRQRVLLNKRFLKC